MRCPELVKNFANRAKQAILAERDELSVPVRRGEILFRVRQMPAVFAPALVPAFGA